MPPDQSAASSATARPADKGTSSQQVDPSVVRRTVDALVAVTGCRRKEARERIGAWQAGGDPLSNLEAWLRANHRVDPTGVEGVRRASRERRVE